MPEAFTFGDGKIINFPLFSDELYSEVITWCGDREWREGEGMWESGEGFK